jgi:hypothetical protein
MRWWLEFFGAELLQARLRSLALSRLGGRFVRQANLISKACKRRPSETCHPIDMVGHEVGEPKRGRAEFALQTDRVEPLHLCASQ